MSFGIYSPCMNFAAGTATVIPLSGVAPYRFSVYDNLGNFLDSNTTGIFSNLTSAPSAPGFWIYAYDSCGAHTSIFEEPATVYYAVNCPFDSNINITYLSGGSSAPYTLTCLNCSPSHADTFTSWPIFYQPTPAFFHLLPDSSYYIRLTDACGNSHIDTVRTLPTVLPVIRHTSCRGIRIAFTTNTGIPIPTGDIDSVSMLYMGTWLHSTDGVFNNLPSSGSLNVSIIGYIHGGCIGRLNSYISNPHFGISEAFMHKDSSCSDVWNLIGALPKEDLPERYYMVNTLHDTISESPSGSGDGAYFYNLRPGNYTLISDSGCSEPFHLDTFRSRWHNMASSVSCNGQPFISEWGYDSLPFNAHILSENFYYSVKLFLHDSLAHWDTIAYNEPRYGSIFPPNLVYISDTGLYTYKIYLVDTGQTYLDSAGHEVTIRLFSPYDTICPIDSGSIYVTDNTIPFPYVNTAYACHGGMAHPPVLTIYGGSLPYTIQIPGLDTFSMNTNTASFPEIAAGTYTVIAYDNCGISRSFTYSIIDTCVTCGAVIASSDTLICRGGSAHLSAHPLHSGGTYLWTPGGSTTAGITVSPAATTTYTVTYSKPGCTDVTDSVLVSVTTAPTIALRDTQTCGSQPVTLTAHTSQSGGTYLWSPGGGTGQSITVSPATYTTYTVTYTLSPCPSVHDSATVFVYSRPFTVWGYSDSIFNFHFEDSVTVGLGPFTYTWIFNDGSPAAHSMNVDHVFPDNSSHSYTVYLIVSDPCGSDTVSHLIHLPTGIETLDLSSHISVYPNPNQGSFILAVDDAETGNLHAEVMDMLGRSIHSQNVHIGENHFNLNLTQGIYLVKVSDAMHYAVKIMVVR